MAATLKSEELDELADALVEVSKILVGIAMRTIPHSAKVTLPQFRALVLLDRAGPMRAADLADELGVSRSSVTRLCDRLVQRSLVARQQADGDRRETLLSATDTARAVVRDAVSRRRRELARLVAEIPVAQRHALLEGLGFLQAAAAPSADTAWSLGWPSAATGGE